MTNVLRTIEIPNFLQKIKKSNRRRATYYTIKSKIPKKYEDKTKYGFMPYTVNRRKRKFTVSYLTDLTTGQRIIKNSVAVGTPSYLAINTNKVWAGFDSEHDRIKLVTELKAFYSSVLKETPITEFPVYNEYIFYVHSERDYDIDNLSWVYIKIFHDWLRDNNLIPEDNVKFIRKYSGEAIPVSSPEERKIVINVRKYEQYEGLLPKPVNIK